MYFLLHPPFSIASSSMQVPNLLAVCNSVGYHFLSEIGHPGCRQATVATGASEQHPVPPTSSVHVDGNVRQRAKDPFMQKPACEQASQVVLF